MYLAIDTKCDIFSIMRDAAQILVRIPHLGARLLSLANRFPFLVEVIAQEILRHEIDINLLETSDPTRATHTSFLYFLSPIACDYENLDSGVYYGKKSLPWVENCYKNDYKPQSISYLVQPPKSKEYGYNKDGKWISLGFVDWNAEPGPTEFSRKPIPKPVILRRLNYTNQLPVAIALLVSRFSLLIFDDSMTDIQTRICMMWNRKY